MQRSDFSKVRVGDKIWTTESEDCMVEKVDDDDSTFCADGIWYEKDGGSPVGTKAFAAFWSKPNIEIPPPPKRMIKKTIRVWAKLLPISKYIADDVTLDEDRAEFWKRRYRVEELAKEIEVEE
jgi:hypothetical protein